MCSPRFDQEYAGITPPPGTHVPIGEERLRLCEREHPEGGPLFVPYPPKEPMLFIKYGMSVCWNEVPSQSAAYHGLRRLGSPARVPGIFYACRQGYTTCIVMEYIPGETVGQHL